MKVTVAERVKQFALEAPNKPGIIALDVHGSETCVTWKALDQRVDCCAAVLAARAGGRATVVMVALPNEAQHVVATLAAWRLNATVVPVDPDIRPAELGRLRSMVGHHLLVVADGVSAEGPICRPADWTDGLGPSGPLARLGVAPRSAMATGGTTGQPRLIIHRRGWVFDDADMPSAHDVAMNLQMGQTQLVVSPLFHGGFGALYKGLALGHTIVLVRTCVPRVVANAIPKYGVNVMRLVPTAMKLLLAPGARIGELDLSSIVSIDHGTAPCPPAVKRRWIDLVGAEHIFETYSSQEQLAFVFIRGDEWLRHPGSVGRPSPGTIAIVDAADHEVAAGRIGRVLMRPADGRPPEYLGQAPPLPRWGDGYFDVGDVGSLDSEGYLFVRGRSGGSINVGGSLVFAAEVEAALMALDEVRDACVVPMAHPILGEAPRALIVPQEAEHDIDLRAVERACRIELTPHKVPLDYRIVTALPRNAAGKLQYDALNEWARRGQ